MNQTELPPPPVALTIAGSDSGGGAGIQMDLAVFSTLGIHGLSAITCLTAQNPSKVNNVHVAPTSMVADQLATVAQYFSIQSIKTGMLFNAEIIREVAQFIRQNPAVPVVVDPVMVSSSGAVLLEKNAIQALFEELIPCATLVTPNLDETRVFLESKPQSQEAMLTAGQSLARQSGVPFLIKGGHLPMHSKVVDILVNPDQTSATYESPWIQNLDTHGSGCLLSSAIAGYLAMGFSLSEAVSSGRRFFSHAAQPGKPIGDKTFLNPSF